MNSALGRDVFWRYWREKRLKVIGNSKGYYTVAVRTRAIPPALEIFLINHLNGRRIRIISVNNAKEWYTAQIFLLPQSKEIETIKRPFMSGNDAL